jgi:streptogrisin C
LSGGVDGMTTAGHCDNSQQWALTGEWLTYVVQARTGSNDEQWSRATTFTASFKNWAADDLTGYRAITAKRSYANQSVGDWVCKYGKMTYFDCGEIISKHGAICSGFATDFLGIEVESPYGTTFVEGGDSGGPWYTGGTALGISSCATPGGKGTYVSTTDIQSGLGVSIKIAP